MQNKAKIHKQVKEKKKRGRPKKETAISQKQIVNIKIGSDLKRKRGRPRKGKNSIPVMQPYNPAQAVSQTLRSGAVEKLVDNSELPPVKPVKPLLIEDAKSEELVVVPNKPSRITKARGKGIITGSKFDHVKTAGLKAIAEDLGVKVKPSWRKERLLKEIENKYKSNQKVNEPIIEEVETPVRKASKKSKVINVNPRGRGRPRKVQSQPQLESDSIDSESLPSSFVTTSRGTHSGFPISPFELSELLLSPEHAEKVRRDNEEYQMGDEDLNSSILREFNIKV